MNLDDRGHGDPGLGSVLREHFGDGVEAVESLTGGFFSRAYAVSAGGREYVVRLNAAAHAAESFAKDDYAWRHFASPDLPIPRVVAIGETDADQYAISERVAGRTLMDCSAAERRTALPALLDTLEVMGNVGVGGSTGYGDWDGGGNARFASWQAFLADIIENHPEGYYKDWHRFLRNGFIERDVFETVYERMLQLAEGCPDMRALIHNDYQFENVIVDGGRVTGVIDWANALYGDPLYDVAWLGWISIHPGWWYEDGIEILRDRFGYATDFDTRITCYELHIGLDHLRFYATTDRRDDYEYCRDWLLAKIDGRAG